MFIRKIRRNIMRSRFSSEITSQGSGSIASFMSNKSRGVPHSSRKVPPVELLNATIEEEPNAEDDSVNFSHRPTNPTSDVNSCEKTGENRKWSLSQYNKTTLEKGISNIAEIPTLDTSLLNVSAIRKSKAEAMGSGTTEGICKMLEELDLENVPPDEDESIQKPESPTVPYMPTLYYKNPSTEEENVVETPGDRSPKEINNNLLPTTSNKIAIQAAKSEVHKRIQSIIQPKTSIVTACGYKQGYLEKKSNGLFSEWKTKYCYFQNSAFIFYGNISTGRVSGYIDFKRVPTKCYTSQPTLCFA